MLAFAPIDRGGDLGVPWRHPMAAHGLGRLDRSKDRVEVRQYRPGGEDGELSETFFPGGIDRQSGDLYRSY